MKSPTIMRAVSRSSVLGPVGFFLLAVAGPLNGVAVGAEAPVNPASAEPAVKMRPFKVIAEWLDIQPLLKKGLIDSVRIARVSPLCPADVAGVKEGMRVIELQGIDVVGLTEEAFIAKLRELPPAEVLTLKVRGITRPTPLVVMVPIGIEAGLVRPRIKELQEADPRALISADQVRAQIAVAKRMFEGGSDPVGMGGLYVASPLSRGVSSYEMAQLFQEFDAIATEHAELLCEAAAKASGRNYGESTLRMILLHPLLRRSDYQPEQKPVIVKHLPKLPDLIEVLDRMNWMEGAEAALAAGWKQVLRDTYSGYARTRYAVLAAPHGVLDAVIDLARTMRDPQPIRNGFRRKDQADAFLAEVTATLQKVVPLENATPAALADHVLKHKSRLVFDAGRRVYVVGK